MVSFPSPARNPAMVVSPPVMVSAPAPPQMVSAPSTGDDVGAVCAGESVAAAGAFDGGGQVVATRRGICGRRHHEGPDNDSGAGDEPAEIAEKNPGRWHG